MTPSLFLSSSPPPKMTSPLLVTSIPYNSLPGCEAAPRAEVGMLNSRAVRALPMETSMLPRKAPSMRVKAFRFPPASTTAMFMGTPCSLALARAPLMTVSACACVMSPGSWSLLTSTPANAVKEKARTIRPDKKRRRMETSICCGMGKTPHPTERSPAFRFLLRYPLAPFSARHYIK